MLSSRASARSRSGSADFQHFSEWLRSCEPFDYVLDGPNIAYYNQNFEQGQFSFRQIEAIMEASRALPSPAVAAALALPSHARWMSRSNAERPHLSHPHPRPAPR